MTERDDHPSGGGEADGLFFLVSGEELHRMMVSLTVAYGYAQLARRRIGREATSGDDGFGEALVQIEAATRAIVEEMRSIMTATTRPHGDTERT